MNIQPTIASVARAVNDGFHHTLEASKVVAQWAGRTISVLSCHLWDMTKTSAKLHWQITKSAGEHLLQFASEVVTLVKPLIIDAGKIIGRAAAGAGHLTFNFVKSKQGVATIFGSTALLTTIMSEKIEDPRKRTAAKVAGLAAAFGSALALTPMTAPMMARILPA
ncbi:MAG: hypothetical protein ACQEP8_00095 [Chlamydiota bacterium]